MSFAFGGRYGKKPSDEGKPPPDEDAMYRIAVKLLESRDKRGILDFKSFDHFEDIIEPFNRRGYVHRVPRELRPFEREQLVDKILAFEGLPLAPNHGDAAVRRFFDNNDVFAISMYLKDGAYSMQAVRCGGAESGILHSVDTESGILSSVGELRGALDPQKRLVLAGLQHQNLGKYDFDGLTFTPFDVAGFSERMYDTKMLQIYDDVVYEAGGVLTSSMKRLNLFPEPSAVFDEGAAQIVPLPPRVADPNKKQERDLAAKHLLLSPINGRYTYFAHALSLRRR